MTISGKYNLPAVVTESDSTLEVAFNEIPAIAPLMYGSNRITKMIPVTISAQSGNVSLDLLFAPRGQSASTREAKIP